MSYTLTDDTEAVELHIWGAGRGLTGVRLRLAQLGAGAVVLQGCFETDELHRAGVVSHDEMRAAQMHAADEARITELERVLDDVLAAFDDGRHQFASTANTAAAGVKRDRLAHWAAVRRGLPAVESDPVASNETSPADVPSNGTYESARSIGQTVGRAMRAEAETRAAMFYGLVDGFTESGRG